MTQTEIKNEIVPLHPHLADHVEEVAELGPMLKHPLVFWTMYHEDFNDDINKVYKSKLKKIKQCYKSKNWSQFILLHERPYRLDAFLGICRDLSNKDYWSLLLSTWLDTEFPTINKEVWLQLFTRKTPGKRKVMSSKERRVLRDLPDKDIDIYRGYGDEQHKDGISWTLSYEKASWFATRFYKEAPIVAEGICDKKDIIAYLNDREEEEIVIDPESVNVLRAQTVLEPPEPSETNS
jgi:hypothetical protein